MTTRPECPALDARHLADLTARDHPIRSVPGSEDCLAWVRTVYKVTVLDEAHKWSTRGCYIQGMTQVTFCTFCLPVNTARDVV